MGTIELIVLLITFMGVPFVLVGAARRMVGLFSRHVAHSDIVIKSDETPDFGVRKMRLAYSGSTPLIVEEVRFRAVLTIPRRRDQIRLWIMRVTACLTNDLELLETVEGPLRPVKARRLLRVLNAMIGFLGLILTVLFFVHPILLIGLLLLGPPEELRVLLASGDRQIDVECPNNGGSCKRPFLVRPGSVNDYVMRCKLYAKRQRFGATRFSGELSVDYVGDVGAQPKWELPHAGKMVWQVEEKLEVVIRGRVVPHTVPLGKGTRLVCIQPQLSESVKPPRKKTSRGVKSGDQGRASLRSPKR